MTAALIVALTLTVTPGMVQFVDRVDEYVEIHRRAAAGLEQPLCADPEELARQSDALAAAIREMRPRAKEGDIFTFAAAEMFRARIAALVRRSNFDVAAFLAGHGGEGADREVGVFETLPWGTHLVVTPLVRELPELPPELDYLFIGRHLLLVDVGANMVVDVLRDALPPPVSAPSPRRRSFCDVHPEIDACWM